MRQAARRPIRPAGNGSARGRAASTVILLGGLWLVASRSAIDTSAGTAVQWNGILAGAAVAVIAAMRLMDWHVGERLRLANATVGGWLIISPLIYGYALWIGSRLAWSDLITGIAITSFALASFAIDANDG